VGVEGLGFNVFNVRQFMTNRRAPNIQTHVKTLPLSLVTLIRNAKSQEIFKLNSLKHIIIIKVEYYRAQTGLTHAITAKSLAIYGPTTSYPHDVFGVVVGTCIGNAPKRRIQTLRRVAAIVP
jgi:hypothetical protein